MTVEQLYLAIGIPSLLALVSIAVMLTLFTSLSRRLQHLEKRIHHLIGTVQELVKRLTRVEIKPGIQP